jgi:FKBP-type peptidyl-prolyl cis-trans isomerase
MSVVVVELFLNYFSMKKEQLKNMAFGLAAAVCISGGAYMMIAGSALGKEGDKNAQLDVVEAISTESIPSTDAPKEKLLRNTKIMNTFTQDGVGVEILQEGQGDAVQNGQVAVVHYTGMFPDGKVFDSSIPRGQAFPVQLGAGMVIQGWEKGLVGMKKGEKRRLTIPPELGYGSQGAGGVIPPNATLLFDVELLQIQ